MSRELYRGGGDQRCLDSNFNDSRSGEEKFTPDSKGRDYDVDKKASNTRSNSTSRSSSRSRTRRQYDIRHGSDYRYNDELDREFNSFREHYSQKFELEQRYHQGSYGSRHETPSRSLSRSPSPETHQPGLSHPTKENEIERGSEHSRHESRDWPSSRYRDWNYRSYDSRSRDYYENEYHSRSRRSRHALERTPEHISRERRYNRDSSIPYGRSRYYDHYHPNSEYHGRERFRENDGYYHSRYESRSRYSDHYRNRYYDWERDYRVRSPEREKEYPRREASPHNRYHDKDERKSPDTYHGKYDSRERDLDREIELRYGDRYHARAYIENGARSPYHEYNKIHTTTGEKSKSNSPTRSDKSEEGAVTPPPKLDSPNSNPEIRSDQTNKSAQDEFTESSKDKSLGNETNTDINFKENEKKQDDLNGSKDIEISEVPKVSFKDLETPELQVYSEDMLLPNNKICSKPEATIDNEIEVTLKTNHNLEFKSAIINDNEVSSKEPELELPEKPENGINHKSSSDDPAYNEAADDQFKRDQSPSEADSKPRIQENEENGQLLYSSYNEPRNYNDSYNNYQDQFKGEGSNNKYSNSHESIHNSCRYNNYHSSSYPRPNFRHKPFYDQASRREYFQPTSSAYSNSNSEPKYCGSWGRSSFRPPLHSQGYHKPINYLRRPSILTFNKPDFLAEFEIGLYPHPWPEKFENDFEAREKELVKLRKTDSDSIVALSRSRFDLLMVDLEIYKLNCAMERLIDDFEKLDLFKV